MALADLTRDEVFVLRPPRPLALEELDHGARKVFAEIESTLEPAPDPTKLLEHSRRFLDQRRAIAGITESITLLEIKTQSAFQQRAGEVIELAQRLTRIDPISILLRDPDFVASVKAAGELNEPPEHLPPGTMKKVVRAVRSLLAYCPIEDLVALGETVARPDLGHGCRLSYDWLSAFVRRNSSPQESSDILGRAYVEGRLTLPEVESLLSLPKPDAIAWLEEHGYARDLQVITLAEEERSERLAHIRKERLDRDGITVLERELVDREVLATQRIEDVDARAWIQVESK